MMEAVAGTLGGINPSEDKDAVDEGGFDPLTEEARASVALDGETQAVGEPATPVAEREEPAPDPEPAKRTGGAPSRTYVVLEELSFEDTPDEKYTVEVHRVEARNAANAIRKAFRELAETRTEDEATLIVVPLSMWRPTPVRLSRKTNVSVSIGA